MVKKIAVRGRDSDGNVVEYGTIEKNSHGHGFGIYVGPGKDAKSAMEMVVKHGIDAGDDAPVIEPATDKWFDLLPLAYTGTLLWCAKI